MAPAFLIIEASVPKPGGGSQREGNTAAELGGRGQGFCCVCRLDRVAIVPLAAATASASLNRRPQRGPVLHGRRRLCLIIIRALELEPRSQRGGGTAAEMGERGQESFAI